MGFFLNWLGVPRPWQQASSKAVNERERENAEDRSQKSMNTRRKGILGDLWASAHHSLISGPKEPGSLTIYSVHSPSFKTRGRSILRTLVSTTNLLPQHGVPSTLFLTHITPPETHFLSKSTDQSLIWSIAEPFVVWNSWGVNFYSR